MYQLITFWDFLKDYLTDTAKQEREENRMEAVGIILLIALLCIAAPFAVWFFIIRTICKYAAKENAKAFDYDYLAQRIAEETIKRIMIIEKQRTATQNKEQETE